jgi:hypothetical protein
MREKRTEEKRHAKQKKRKKVTTPFYNTKMEKFS